MFRLSICDLSSFPTLLSASADGFITGGKDGNINVWDATFKTKVKTFAVSKGSLAEDSAAMVKDMPGIRAVCFAKVLPLSVISLLKPIGFDCRRDIDGRDCVGEPRWCGEGDAAGTR
jgi:hypothetical protein